MGGIRHTRNSGTIFSESNKHTRDLVIPKALSFRRYTPAPAVLSLLKAPLETPSFGMAVKCAVALDISSMCAKNEL